jgi:hypothetical protein
MISGPGWDGKGNADGGPTTDLECACGRLIDANRESSSHGFTNGNKPVLSMRFGFPAGLGVGAFGAVPERIHITKHD